LETSNQCCSCFTALGIPLDAGDDLVRFAYRRQVETDPASTHFYLTYLVQVADERSSEALQTEVAMERSGGKFDFRQLAEAYRYFNFKVDSPPSDDEYIIGTFQARVQDAPVHEAQMLEHLRVIGSHRQSRRILDVAEDCTSTYSNPTRIIIDTKISSAVNSYDQALAFLRGEPATPDDFILPLFTAKASHEQ
jgi:ubiquitin carboxyl-terminal hydrolase 25